MWSLKSRRSGRQCRTCLLYTSLNLFCCLIAKKAGKCHTIARVRNPVYSNEIGFIKEQLGISMIINPELAAATEISRILRFPSAIKIDPFAKGKVELLKFKIKPEFHMDGLTVMDVDSQLRCDVLIGAVERGDDVTIPAGNFVLHDGDMVSTVSYTHLDVYKRQVQSSSCSITLI